MGWKWSHELKGPLKVPRHDPLASFRVKDFLLKAEEPIWEKLESLYVDDEPLEETPDEEEFGDLVDALEGSFHLGGAKRSELIEDPGDVEASSLSELALGGRGRRSAMGRGSGRSGK